MKIMPVDLENEEEIKAIINMIYDVFLSCNAKDSTERLVQRMEVLYGPSYNYEYTLAHLQKTNLFFVAKEQNTILGIVRGTPEKLSNLFIPKEQQGKGVGKQLLEMFEHEAKNLGSTCIHLKSSKYALPFYLKNGYAIEYDNRLIKYI